MPTELLSQSFFGDEEEGREEDDEEDDEEEEDGDDDDAELGDLLELSVGWWGEVLVRGSQISSATGTKGRINADSSEGSLSGKAEDISVFLSLSLTSSVFVCVCVDVSLLVSVFVFVDTSGAESREWLLEGFV